jgi:ABC-type transport system substrate-binding protein
MRLQNREPDKYHKGSEVAALMEWPTGSELFDSYQALETNFSARGANSVLINEQADPELDAMIKDAGKIVDPKQRAEALKKVWAYLAPKAYSIPVVTLQKIHGMASNVEWKPRSDGYIKASDMKFK